MNKPFAKLNLFPVTADSEKNKVVSQTPRTPVNMAAARVIWPAPWWSRPLPPEPDLAKPENIAALRDENLRLAKSVASQRALLEGLHRRNALLKKSLGESQAEVVALSKALRELRTEADTVFHQLKRFLKT